MTARYGELLDLLRTAYDAAAGERDAYDKEPWKLSERATFAERLHASGARRLLEIGAGTGQDSAYLQQQGLDVTATDLSAEMVARCRAKGVDAYQVDFLGLDTRFPPASFDAVYALNCLLHVPNAELPRVLAAIRGLLRPGGLFFLGVYGSEDHEGPIPDDHHVPPRFFCFRTDARLRRYAEQAGFHIDDFHIVGTGRRRFQSLTLRRPPAAPGSAQTG